MRSSQSSSDVDLAFSAVRTCGFALDYHYRVEHDETRKLDECMGSTGQGSITVVEPAERKTRANGARILFALKLPKERHAAAVRREIEVWMRLAHHLNVASLHEVGCEGGVPCLLTPYATLGNLEQYIHDLPTCDDATLEYDVANLQEPLCFGYQIACGLEFLHHQALIHSDIKPSNVLVYSGRFNRDIDVVLKICDLGYASASRRDHEQAELEGQRLGCGTRGFAPPELNQSGEKNIVSERTDTWGLVMCLLYALHGCLPKEVVEVPPPDRRERFLQLCAGGNLFEALDCTWQCPVSCAVRELIANGLRPERADRPLARDCTNRLSSLFLAAGGADDFEHPGVQVVLRESAAKEREYLVARHVDNDQEKAGLLWRQLQELLKQEQGRERRSPVIPKPHSLPVTVTAPSKRQRVDFLGSDAGGGSCAAQDSSPQPVPKYYVGRHRASRKNAASQGASCRGRP